jgi:hypothetical protein
MEAPTERLPALAAWQAGSLLARMPWLVMEADPREPTPVWDSVVRDGLDAKEPDTEGV